MINKSRWFAFQDKDEDYEIVETREFGKIPKSPIDGLRSIQRIDKEFLADEKIYKIRVTYRPKGLWYKLFEQKDRIEYKQVLDVTELLMPTGGAILDPGYPMLPTEGIFVALPPGASFKEFKIVNSVEKTFPGVIFVLPAPEPTIDSGIDWIPPKYVPNADIYESNEWFPKEIVELVSAHDRVGDVPTIHLMVYPLSYKPLSLELKAFSLIEIDIFYTVPGKPVERLRGGFDLPRPRLRAPIDTIRRELRGDILNIDAAADEFVPDDSGKLTDNTNKGQYLIITKSDLMDALDELVEMKKAKYSVKVVTIKQIFKEFGEESEESIKEFLKYAYDNWQEPPEYVLLIGDVNRIPAHVYRFWDPYRRQYYYCASDSYYTRLRGSLTPTLLIGRLAVDDKAELKAYIKKLKEYQSTIDNRDEWLKRILLTAYNDWGYKNCSDDCAEILVNGTNATVIKLYDGTATKREVLEEINKGAMIVNYRGHGDIFEWSAYNHITVEDLKKLKNSEKPSIIFSIACSTASIDHEISGDCFGEAFVELTKTGAIGFLGASRPSYTQTNHHFNRFLFQAIAEKKFTKVGEIFNWATNQLLKNFSDECTRVNSAMYLWLGDPDVDLPPL